MSDDSFEKPLNVTLEEGLRALAAHAREKGDQIQKKYGKFDNEVLEALLEDEDFVRYPTRIVYDSSRIEKGLFAITERVGEAASDGYVIYIHEFFKQKPEAIPAIVLYHLVTVNYGDFATYNEAEEFAASVLGLEKNVYYEYLCLLMDLLEKNQVK